MFWDEHLTWLMRRALRSGGLLVVAAALAAAACGGGDDDVTTGDGQEGAAAAPAAAEAAVDGDHAVAPAPPPPDRAGQLEPIPADPAAAGVAAIQSGRFSLDVQLQLDEVPTLPEEQQFVQPLIGLLQDLHAEGAFNAAGDFEVAAEFGSGAPIPSIELVSAGGALYTNIGFGWTEGTAGLPALLGAFGLDADGLELDPADLDLGGLDIGDLDFGALDLGGLGPFDVSGGGLGLFGEDIIGELTAAGFEKVGTDTIDGREADRWHGSGDAVAALAAEDGATAEAERLDIDVWIDRESGQPLKVESSGKRISIADPGAGTTVRIDDLDLAIAIDPATQTPVSFNLRIKGVEVISLDPVDGGTVRIDEVAVTFAIDPATETLVLLDVTLTRLDATGAPVDALAAARGDVRVRFALTNLNDRIAIEAPPVTS